jgi:hypothetical protein
VLIALLIAAVPAARTLETRAAVRAGSTMDRAMARLGDRPLFQVGFSPDYGLRAPVIRIAAEDVCSVPDDAVLYAYRSAPIPRSAASPAAQAVFDVLRRQTPLAQVRSYAGLALYYYEFPLIPSWLDQGDVLTSFQALYDARPVKQETCPIR